MELKRIDVGSSAQVGAALHGVAGLFGALLFAALSVSTAVGQGGSLGQGLAGAVLALVFFPLAQAAFGALVVAAAAAIYNLVAARVGGIRFDLA